MRNPAKNLAFSLAIFRNMMLTTPSIERVPGEESEERLR